MQVDERRRHRRVRLSGQARGRATVFTDFRLAALSETGAELETAVPLAVGSRCDLTLDLAGGTLEVKGRVADVRPPAADGHYVVGVDFVTLDALDHALLRSFLERERAKER